MKIVKPSMLVVAALFVAPLCLMSCLRGGTIKAIEISPADATVAKGTSEQFTATAIFTDGTRLNWTTAVTWESSNPAFATISNATGSQGVVTAVEEGNTTITATDLSNNFSATTTLTITKALTMIVTPAVSIISLGTSTQFTAKETFNNGNTTLDVTPLVFWESSDTAVATISNVAGTNGHAVSLATGTTGTTIITATDLVTNVTGSATLVVQ